MKVSIQKALNLYPSEMLKTFFFALLAFLWSFSVALSLTLFDGLFLEHLGAKHLPKAYAVGGLFVILISFWFLRAMKTRSLAAIFSTILLVEIALFAFFIGSGIMFSNLPEWIFFAYRVLAYMSLAVVTTAFWSFTDQYFDLQDAKRIYSIVFSCLFLGAISANFCITLGYVFVGNIGLGVLILLGFLLSFFIVHTVKRKFMIAHDDTSDGSDVVGVSFKELLLQIFTSKYTLFLTLYSILAELIWNITEFGYLSEFQIYFQSLDPTAFKTDPRLIQYLATTKGLVSLFNVFLSLFIYSRLVKKISVNRTIFVPFVLFFLLYSTWVGFSNLVIATVALVLVEGVLYTFGDNNFSLLLHGTPNKIRIPYRVITAAFLEPFALLLTAGFLSVPFFNPIILGFFFVSLMLLTTFLLNLHYKKAILQNLRKAHLSLTKPIASFFKHFSKKEKIGIKKQLETLKPSAFIFEILEHFQNKNTQIAYLELLDDTTLFAILSKEKFSHLLKSPKLIELLRAKKSIQSMVFLAKAKALSVNKALRFLKTSSLELKKAGIITLLFTHEHKKALDAFDALFTNDKKNYIIASLEIIANVKGVKTVQELIPFLKQPNFCDAAIKAIKAQETLDVFSALKIIKSMHLHEQQEYRICAIESLYFQLSPFILEHLIKASIYFKPSEKRAIEKLVIKKGLSLVGKLLDLTKSQDELAVKLLAGRCLGDLSYKILQKHIDEIIEPEIHNALFLFYVSNHPNEKFQKKLGVLKETLRIGFDKTFDFIIQMLSLAGSIEDSELLTYSLRSSNEKTQAHAVETLEKTTKPKMFAKLECLIDDRPVLEKIQECLRLKPELEKLTIKDVVDTMKQSKQLIDQMTLVLFLKQKAPSEEKQILLDHFDNPLFQPFALGVLKK
ncbi:MAG: hypothetical protein K940chlam8_01290 [Chlamydiae bacterium]|nr:hypothetical protein [Chlamydiota bacterium]